MKNSPPPPKRMLVGRCPICGASRNESCELATGQRPTYPHAEREGEVKIAGRKLRNT